MYEFCFFFLSISCLGTLSHFFLASAFAFLPAIPHVWEVTFGIGMLYECLFLSFLKNTSYEMGVAGYTFGRSTLSLSLLIIILLCVS